MSKRKTTKEFINDAIKIHGNKYDYKLVKYVNNRTKVVIVCQIHGNFRQRPCKHIFEQQGCPKCCKNSKLTTKRFIKKAINIHGNKYNYDLVEYINSQIKVKIICQKHGLFEQIPASHLFGFGCFRCGINEGAKNKRFDIEKFISKSIKKHGNKYDYSNAIYKGIFTKLTIKCNKCKNIFEQAPNNHLRGQGCPKCARNIKLTTEEFIKNAIKIHGNKYRYDLVKYKNNYTKINIICNKCNNTFKQSPHNHLRGQGCSICNICNTSKGEYKIKQFLDYLNIKYNSQKTFENCKHKHKLQFDFYLSEFNLCIEYDGKHHFKFIKHFHKTREGFIERKNIDIIKEKYCKDNNINLLRIPYTEFNNIEDIILNKINEFKTKIRKTYLL